jgi:hypothetical protein
MRRVRSITRVNAGTSFPNGTPRNSCDTSSPSNPEADGELGGDIELGSGRMTFAAGASRGNHVRRAFLLMPVDTT